MAKAFALVSALCFLALASFTHAEEGKLQNSVVYKVYGMVYCDPCNVEFQTRLSDPIEGAKVQLQCRNRDNGTVTLTSVVVTDKDGSYWMQVGGDHEEEICEVSTISSPKAECNVNFENTFKARVLLTDNSGVQGPERYANPIGFKSSSVAPECKDVLAELGIVVV